MKVSVLIPAYNAEKYICRCLDSLLMQTFKNFELLIVNDGSTDNTQTLLENYANRFHDYHIFSIANGGSANARNMLLNEAQGEYVCFIDADDYVHPKYLEGLVSEADREAADIVQCQFNIVHDQEGFFTDETLGKKQAFDRIGFYEYFCSKKGYLKVVVLWNKIFRRKLFDGITFPLKKAIDDEYVICQVIYNAKKIIEIDSVLYYYFMSPNSQMRSKPSLNRINRLEVIEEQMHFFVSIGYEHLRNMLLYRYYSSVVSLCTFVKHNYPNEIQIISDLEHKKRSWPRALLVKEIPLQDKLLLIARTIFPSLFHRIHQKFEKVK